jgi:hypothetical protein
VGAARRVMPALGAFIHERANIERVITMEGLVKLILSQIPRYLSNVAGLVSSPKKFVRERNTFSDEELIKALIFLAISFVLCVVLQIPLMPDKVDFWKLVVVRGVLTLVLIMLNVVALRMAWRIVGGKAQFGSFLITYSYYFAIVLLLVSLTFLCIAGTIKLLLPEAWAAAQAGKQIDPDALDQSARVASSIGFFAFLLLGITGLYAWLILGWGAYRELNGLSKRNSVAAWIIYNFLLIPVLIITIVLSSTIS